MSSSDNSFYSSFSSSSSSFSLSSSPCCQFSLDEIKVATNNFDDEKILGHGGEGKVYLAEIYLKSKTEKTLVAVKHLKQTSTEFEKEIQTVTKIQHPHLVPLLGYCNESDEKILIYEYMENGSLSDYVKKDSPICLSWKKRLNICLGAAYGLQHLHRQTDESPKGIIHRDVKPANILLDKNWVAKVSDFGMFKLSNSAQIKSTLSTYLLKGTPGYFAPEYALSYHITRKIDVYAFGVVMFEVLCRKKPWDRGNGSWYIPKNQDLGDWAKENVDINIKEDIFYKSLNVFTDAIGRSLRADPKGRPTIDGVVMSLESALKCQEQEDERFWNIGLKAPSERSQARPLLASQQAPQPPSRPISSTLPSSSRESALSSSFVSERSQVTGSSVLPRKAPWSDFRIDEKWPRLFFKRPPDGLLAFVDRVYVFDSCFSTEVLPQELYQRYLNEIITELHGEFPESSFLAFNFREGEKTSQFAKILRKYNFNVLEYPQQYDGCALLPLFLIQHFLRTCEIWLLNGNPDNIILLHCERGGWPILAFLMASFLIFRKIQSEERKSLEIVYRESPKGLVESSSPLNPLPSQLRYLEYISHMNSSLVLNPPVMALSLDSLILRAIPRFDSHTGCRPIIRVFGRSLLSMDGPLTQMLFSMPDRGENLRRYSEEDSDETIKIDIQCLVKGDVVLECVHLDLEPEREVLMFRVMFNTAFITSNILMLNLEELDFCWYSMGRYPKSFRAEVHFRDIESISLPENSTPILNDLDKGWAEWVGCDDNEALMLLKQLSIWNDVKE